MPRPPPLSHAVRAELFRQLARMEAAGLPFDQVLTLLTLTRREQRRVTAMQRWIARRLDIADAGLHSGLFTPMEAALVRTAINAGSPAATYSRLSERYARRGLQSRKIKARLALPVAVFVIACFIGPLPALIGSTIGPAAYLWAVSKPLLLAGALAWICGAFPLWSEQPHLRPLVEAIDTLLPSLPLFGEMSLRRTLRDGFESLALLLEAGVPMLGALPLATAAMRNRVLRERFAQLPSRIETGLSFAQALREIGFPGRDRALPLIVAGEASGALPDTLQRYADSESQAIDDFDDLVADWTPRLVYLLVAAWMAHSLLTGPGLVTTLPAELR